MKSDKRCKCDNNGINKLPDDILLIILSFLTPKEAAQTSVLSSRWISLWKHTSCLNFDADKAMYKIARLKKLGNKERGKYVKCVNSVLRSHQQSILKEFVVRFDLRKPAHNAITQWLEYAFARNVQSLLLDLSPARPDEASYCRSLSYALPEKLLTSFEFKYLEVLSLKYVDVNGEAIEFFLRNCPLLEKLTVHKADRISNLEVCGSSLVLKHLEICSCSNLKGLKISAPNLTSLRVMLLERLLLENVPMLGEVSFFGGYGSICLRNTLPALFCCISQLETLYLLLDYSKLPEFPEMPKLKKLAVEFDETNDNSLSGLTSLIAAAPRIREFVLMLNWCELSMLDKNTITFRHTHLKTFKFCGYCGRDCHVELVRYFLENCVALEKVIVDSYYAPYHLYPPIPPAKLVAERNARSHATQHLRAEVPQHIKLLIL